MNRFSKLVLSVAVVSVIVTGCGWQKRTDKLDFTSVEENQEDLPEYDVIIFNVDAHISTEDILSYDSAWKSRNKPVLQVTEPELEHPEPNAFIEIAGDGSIKAQGKSYTIEEFYNEIYRLVKEDSSRQKLTGYRFHVSADQVLKSQPVMDVVSLIKNNLRGASVEILDSSEQLIPVFMPGVSSTSDNDPEVSLVINSRKIDVGGLNTVSIYLRRSGEIEFNGEIKDFEETESLTRRIFNVTQTGHNLAIVRVDGDVEWSRTLKYLSMARNAGAEYLAVMRARPMEMD